MIELPGVPRLDSPVLIAAFEGWNDAADAATAAIAHLTRVWDARPYGALDPDEFYDFQVNRPIIQREDAEDADGNLESDEGPDESVAGELEVVGSPARQIVWPTTRILYARPPAAPRDILLVRGLEPNMRWRQFCAELLALADDAEVEFGVLFGALLADNPHTRPIPITTTSPDEGLREAFGLEPSTYDGPTGILGVFADACERTDLPAASVWAAVPHYVAQPPCPKATLALLRRLEDLLDAPMPFGELPEEAKAWERGVDDLARDDSEVSEYVRSLEEARDAADLPEATGDAIAAEFERYLRRRPDAGNGPGTGPGSGPGSGTGPGSGPGSGSGA